MEIKDIVNAFDEEEINNNTREKVFSLMGKLEEYHKPTFEHSLRTGLLSRGLGGMQNREPKAGLYGVLHDIGKLKIPKSLLDKCEGFDEKDRKIMMTHVSEGHRILSEAGLYFSAWIALTHHRYQPNFYPNDEEMVNYPFPIRNANPSTKLLADTWSSLVGIADSHDSARNRKNDKFGGRTLSPQELKEWLIKQNPSSEQIIIKAYENGILS